MVPSILTRGVNGVGLLVFTLAAHELEEFFYSCAVVSIYGSGGE